VVHKFAERQDGGLLITPQEESYGDANAVPVKVPPGGIAGVVEKLADGFSLFAGDDSHEYGLSRFIDMRIVSSTRRPVQDHLQLLCSSTAGHGQMAMPAL